MLTQGAGTDRMEALFKDFRLALPHDKSTLSNSSRTDMLIWQGQNSHLSAGIRCFEFAKDSELTLHDRHDIRFSNSNFTFCSARYIVSIQ